jgi:hypothetical protein
VVNFYISVYNRELQLGYYQSLLLILIQRLNAVIQELFIDIRCKGEDFGIYFSEVSEMKKAYELLFECMRIGYLESED